MNTTKRLRREFDGSWRAEPPSVQPCRYHTKRLWYNLSLFESLERRPPGSFDVDFLRLAIPCIPRPVHLAEIELAIKGQQRHDEELEDP